MIASTERSLQICNWHAANEPFSSLSVVKPNMDSTNTVTGFSHLYSARKCQNETCQPVCNPPLAAKGANFAITIEEIARIPKFN